MTQQEWDIISTYSFTDAINDGVLIPFAQHRWAQLSGGKPIVITANIAARFSLAAIQEIWNTYVTAAQRDRSLARVTTTMDGYAVIVDFSDGHYTIMFPEDD